MGDAEEDAEGLDPEPRHAAWERICPMCNDPFESAWAVHRICGKCRANFPGAAAAFSWRADMGALRSGEGPIAGGAGSA